MKRIVTTVAPLLLLLTLALALAGCSVTGEAKVTFVVDGATYHTLTTAGKEILTLPTDPEKDGFVFDGWYFDENFSRLFTADALKESVPTEDITVYAKWKTGEEAHTHTPSDWIVDTAASCTEPGAKHKECTECGALLEGGTVPATGHTPSDWIVDTEATEQTKGEKHKECTVCHTVTESAEIPVLTHTHTYAEGWSCDNAHHWHACTGANCTEVTDKAEHTIADGICTVCKKDFTSKGLAYTLNEDKTAYTVTGIGTCTDTDLILPSMYEGLPVTAIATGAFGNLSSLTSVTIGNRVKTIGDLAFYNCAFLKSITIGESVEKIGFYAFCNTMSLTEINFNAKECEDLGIVVKNDFWGEPYLSEFDTYIFANAGIAEGGITVTFGKNVTRVPAKLFCNIPYDSVNYLPPRVAKVVFAEDSVCESIGKKAFHDCFALLSITLSERVTSIGEYAFSGCSKLVEVINHSELAIIAGSDELGYIGYHALAVHDGESKIVMKDGYQFITDGDGAHYLIGYTGTETVLTLPQDYDGDPYKIINEAFAYCISLRSVIIPEKVTEIDAYAFNIPLAEVILEGNRSLSIDAISVHKGESKIVAKDGYLFITDEDGTHYLIGYTGTETALALPENYDGDAYEVCTGAFWCSPSLKSVIIPEGVTGIDDGAFMDCTSLVSVTFGENSKLTSIGEAAFAGCTLLENITIPQGVTSIGYCVFENCLSLRKVTIGDGVTSIGTRAFFGCSALASLTIGKSLTSIEDEALSGCLSLTEINFNATACEDFESYIFASYNAGQNGGGITVTIGANVTRIPARLFGGAKISRVIFAEGSVCESIGEYAFYWCTSLTSITIPSRVASN